MIDYRKAKSTMHTRLMDFTLQEYLFVLQVVLGEEPALAYANVFDVEEFNRNVPSEDEEDYIAKHKREAEVLLDQAHCQHLKDYLNEEFQAEVQNAVSTLKDYRFSGAEIQKLLNNLLKNRTETLDEASVRDVLSLIKTMFDNGFLDSDDAWTKHFITIPKKFNALCPQCNHELYAVEGLNIVCKHCNTVFTWSETERRFYPQFSKL